MNSQNSTDSAQRVAQGLGEADSLRRAGRLAEAERVCRQLVESYPTHPGPLNFLALLLKDKGELIESEGLFRRAIAAAPKEAVLHNNLATVLRARKELAAAQRALLDAIALRPDYSEAYYNLGVVRREAGFALEALATFRKAVDFNPRNVEARIQVASLLEETGDHDDALKAIDSAIAIARDSFAAHYCRGTVLTSLERYDEAIAAFDTALALRPNHHAVLHAKGNALARARRENDAIEQYRKAIDAAPGFLEAHRDYNILLWEMGRHDENLKSYIRAREKVGDTPDLLLAEANQRIRHEQGAEAERLLRLAVARAPERTDIANALARALIQQRKFDESVRVLDELVKREPHAIYNHRDAAIALLQMGEAREAARYLEDARVRAPLDQLVLAHLALAWRELGDSRLDALVDLEKYVGVYEIEPPRGFPDAESFNRALQEDLRALHTRQVEPFDQTLRGGTQTPGYLFDRRTRAIEGIQERIREAVADYVGRLERIPDHPLLARKSDTFDFATAWSCMLKSSGFHTNHIHPKGWISSAYYAALPAVVSDGTGEQGWIKFGESNLQLGERDRPGRMIKPSVGRLVLFPSYYWHGTVPFVSDQSRLTIAFDIVPGRVDAWARTSGY